MSPRTYTLDLEGKTLQIEFNTLAEQANGSVLVQMGGTLVLVTAVMSEKEKEGVDFFPLTVEYEEKYYAAGKIGGSRFMKREGKPSDEAILNARLIDRAIRPLFPNGLRREIQVIATVLSWDTENDADVLAMMGASLALSTSSIPWNGPIGAVRLGFNQEEKKWITNPSYQDREKALGEIVFSGCEDNGVVINMVEAGFAQIEEKHVEEASLLAVSFIKKILDFQEEIIEKEGKEKMAVSSPTEDKELPSQIHSFADKKLEELLFKGDRTNQKERMKQVELLKEELTTHILEQGGDQAKASLSKTIFDKILDELVHTRAVEKGERPDGRKLDEVRQISVRTRLLPRTHGSGVFIRGTTKALSIVTLGAPGDQQLLEGMEITGKKRFMHHYNFPPFCSGEVKPMRGPGRREIGHGMLAERALLSIIPTTEEFPYTIRVVTEILSSNGSTSMASVSASCLALIDAGVPVKNVITGISIGLMSGPNGAYKLLTDIQGPEDHHGDMDFKVAGTKDGICAIQMDVKIKGITTPMFKEALERAREARFHIMKEMEKGIPEPRPSLSPYAPRITVLQINPEKIGAVIGPGGKIINEIIDVTGVTIDIEDDGKVFITSPTPEAMEKAVQWVKELTHEVSVDEVYDGIVKRVMDFGAFVEILPGQEGLVHISRLAPGHVEKTEDVVHMDDVVTVKVIEIDNQGRINLTLKDKNSGQFIEKELRPRPDFDRPRERRSFRR